MRRGPLDGRPGNEGYPDRLIVMPGGRVGFLELKRKGERPTALQLERMRGLVNLGVPVGWVDDLEGAKRYVRVLGGVTGAV